MASNNNNNKKNDEVTRKLAAYGVLYGLPDDFTEQGWRTHVGTGLGRVHPVMELLDKAGGDLPDKATVEQCAARMVVQDRGKSDADSPYVLTDDMVRKSRDLDKLFDLALREISDKTLPAYVNVLPKALENYIADKFIMTTNDSGERICYWRDIDQPGRVWIEGNSQNPFSKLHGTLKSKINATFALHVRERNVMVMRKKDDGTAEIESGVNLADLYRENHKAMLELVEHSTEGVAYNFFIERMRTLTQALDRNAKGLLSKSEQATGMVDLIELYKDIDKKLDMYEQFYHKDPGIKAYTNDPEEDAFTFFDLDSIHPGDTPAFDMFMTGVVPACRNTLMAAIYGSFFAKCHLNQYIWMHGEGGDGKSSLLNAIRKYCGDSMCCSLRSDSAKSEFGLEECVGKRLVFFPDVQGGLSVKSTLIHNLTGHDPISINRKNKPHVSVSPDCIVWLAGNLAPDVNFNNQNEARRIVYIKMQQPSIEVQKKIYYLNDDGTFQLDAEGHKVNNGFPLEKMLIDEMPAILYKCKAAFEQNVSEPYSVIRKSSEEHALANANCVDQDDDNMTFYIKKSFRFTNDHNNKVANADIIERLNETLKEHRQPLLDTFTRSQVFRKLKTLFGCNVMKSNGVRFHTGILLSYNDDGDIEKSDEYYKSAVFRKVDDDPKDLITPIEQQSAGAFV